MGSPLKGHTLQGGLIPRGPSRLGVVEGRGPPGSAASFCSALGLRLFEAWEFLGDQHFFGPWGFLGTTTLWDLRIWGLTAF